MEICKKSTQRLLNCILAVQTQYHLILLSTVLGLNMEKSSIFEGNEMETTKRYQLSPSKPLCQKKPGPKQQLGLDDEVMLVLMRIRLDSPIKDLAFRFEISAGYASKVFTTITIFLARELKSLIYEQTMSYKHPHFSGDFNKV